MRKLLKSDRLFGISTLGGPIKVSGVDLIAGFFFMFSHPRPLPKPDTAMSIH